MQTPPDPSGSRDHGPQPLVELLAKHSLRTHDLVAASTQQLNHKMVARALKGRQLTPNVMGKVLEALGKACGQGVQRRRGLYVCSATFAEGRPPTQSTECGFLSIATNRTASRSIETPKAQAKGVRSWRLGATASRQVPSAGVSPSAPRGMRGTRQGSGLPRASLRDFAAEVRGLGDALKRLRLGGQFRSSGSAKQARLESAAPLGLNQQETASELRSTEEVNAIPTSISTTEPLWSGGSSSAAHLGGEYNGAQGDDTRDLHRHGLGHSRPGAHSRSR